MIGAERCDDQDAASCLSRRGRQHRDGRIVGELEIIHEEDDRAILGHRGEDVRHRILGREPFPEFAKAGKRAPSLGSSATIVASAAGDAAPRPGAEARPANTDFATCAAVSRPPDGKGRVMTPSPALPGPEEILR